MGLECGTVSKYIKNLYIKTNTKGAAALVMYAIKHGWIKV